MIHCVAIDQTNYWPLEPAELRRLVKLVIANMKTGTPKQVTRPTSTLSGLAESAKVVIAKVSSQTSNLFARKEISRARESCIS